MDQKKDKDVLREIIETGSEISGGIAGSIIGALTAGPVGLILGGSAGPIITKVFKEIGLEMRNRMLAPRELIRMGAVYAFAINKLRQAETSGAKLRSVEYFNGDKARSPGEEILEGVILNAQREYEERKVKFLGNLYANICLDSSITREHASQLIRLTSNVSFRQLCILQALRLVGVDFKSKLDGVGKIVQEDLILELRDLQQKRLINISELLSPAPPSGRPIDFNSIRITTSGVNFCKMLSLEEIEEEELSAVKEFLMPRT